MSGGRLILGLGAGWYEREYQAYGYDVPVGRDRLAILEETRAGRAGALDRRDGHVPRQAPALRRRLLRPQAAPAAPRVWIGGGGEQVTLRIAASTPTRRTGRSAWTASATSRRCSPSHCERPRPRLRLDRAHPRARLSALRYRSRPGAWLASPGGGHCGVDTTDEYVRDNFVGTAEQVAEKVQAFVDAGCREFVLWFRDSPASDSLEAFARDVIPRVRG